MAEITVKIGKKGDESKVDKSKITKGSKPKQMGGAEGQYAYVTAVTCWNCYAVNEITADTNFQVGFYCWNCGAYCVY
ncbi:MAG TPA: hypothetical protein VHZ56_05320 [Devosia sp.]|jgi:hypothetical protein|nr:hypothetical protein [Devosia sp.]